MRRREIFGAFLFLVPCFAEEAKPTTIRGKLLPGGVLETSKGRITLTGDDPTKSVLKDSRVAGIDFEAVGHFTSPTEFTIDPIHTRSMFTFKDGKRLMVTYWCDICYIRTYSPGKCWCCQEETTLDFIDPDTVDKK